MIVPNYKKGDIPTQFYPYVIEVMQMISRRKDICTILYTCSHMDEVAKYQEVFKKHGIVFDFVNSNGEVDSQGYGCYDKKPYFNVLFEDKSGFDPMTDWIRVKNHLVMFPEDILSPTIEENERITPSTK